MEDKHGKNPAEDGCAGIKKERISPLKFLSLPLTKFE